MAANGTTKEKFNRIYYTHNPNRYRGPDTQIVDTALTPIAETKNG